MSPNPKLIEAILTNATLSEEEKSKLIAEFIDNLQQTYPELKYHATKADVKEVEKKLGETELKLTKEIEDVRKEIEVVRKEMKEVELKLSKEIEEVRKEIKEVELKLSKEIKEVKFTMIRWSFLFWASQFSALAFLIYKSLQG